MRSFMDYYFVYITTGSVEEARSIGGNLVRDKLAACINILPQMESIYFWDGDLQQDQETVLIAKTRGDLLEKLTEYVKSSHSYSCPCVAVLKASPGNRDYFQWLDDQLKSACS